MTAAGALAMGRRFAEAQMRGRCTIFTDSEPVTDRTTGKVTFTDLEPDPDVPCRVRPAGSQDATAEAGGDEVITAGFVISIPIGHQPVPVVKRRLRITAYPEDPALVGVEFEIRQVAAGDVTARRLACDRID